MCLLPCNVFTNYTCSVCHFGYTTAATNLAASDLTFTPGGCSPHGLPKSANRGKWVLNVVTSDTTTNYTSLYIKKNCVSQQEPQRRVVTESSDGTIREDGQNW